LSESNGSAAPETRIDTPAATVEFWRCPRCRGLLEWRIDDLRCLSCATAYPQVDGIPDLRIPGESWIEVEQDLTIARGLACMDVPVDVLVRAVYAGQPGRDEASIALRTRQVLGGPDRLGPEVGGWLRKAIRPDGLFMDLGCGAGMVLVAAARQGAAGVGVDVSMTWLVVAKRMIAAQGGTPVLAAALGEALPIADAVLDGVVSLDVIEHVRNPEAYLREIDRVTKPGGGLALSTPNRFSLAPEPHVFVWGVGWLPRRYQEGYVRWRSGMSYSGTYLLSSFGLAQRLKRFTRFDFRILIPPVPAEELAHFSPLKTWLARVYNTLSRAALARGLFLLVGPFFQVTGVRRSGGS
jgi:SAM-dependent methyltransferase